MAMPPDPPRALRGAWVYSKGLTKIVLPPGFRSNILAAPLQLVQLETRLQRLIAKVCSCQQYSVLQKCAHVSNIASTPRKVHCDCSRICEVLGYCFGALLVYCFYILDNIDYSTGKL